MALEAGHDVFDIYAMTAGKKALFDDHIHYGQKLRNIVTDHLIYHHIVPLTRENKLP